MLPEPLLAEVKFLIATRLGLDTDSIDVDVTVSDKQDDPIIAFERAHIEAFAAMDRLHKFADRFRKEQDQRESGSWPYSSTISIGTSTTTTEDD